MGLRTPLLRIVLLGIFDVIALQLAVALGTQVSALLGIGIAVLTIITNIVFFDERLGPWRWVMPAFIGMALLVIYPIGYSIIVAFSNYGDGHLLNKQQVLNQLLAVTYEPANPVTYRPTSFAPVNKENVQREDLIFWLVDPEGKGFVGSTQREGLLTPEEASTVYGKIGELDSNGVPASIEGYTRLNAIQAAQYFRARDAVDRGRAIINAGEYFISVGGTNASRQVKEFNYDPATDTLTSNRTGEVYTAFQGNYVTGEGENRNVLQPGWGDFIGLRNITRVIEDERIRDQFVRVFLWTVVFALSSVFLTFAVGLGFALVLNSKNLPLRTMWRSLLIVPYAIPFWLTAKTWAGLLNPQYGPINKLIEGVTGTSPNWFADPTLAKIMILVVNLYLGFPYMMLITLGALQSIPSDMYEAATIDGANVVNQFRFITLPLLLVAVGPLLVASFAFNFNNFTLIELLTAGGPPIAADAIAGHTDILLSYTYRLAFAGARGTDYGFAAAIGIFIFIVVGTITFFNFRVTGQLESAAN
jgi:ABC-type sugar transport system permease subunit